VNTPKTRRPALLIAAAVVLSIVAIAVVKRDAIADRILRGSDSVLMGDEARVSPHATLAVEFLGALRAKDLEAIARLATLEEIEHIHQETAQPSADSEAARAEWLDDLPADPAELRSKIKSAQTHEDQAVVTFETRANSWFVKLALTNGAWKVSWF
jgi:hypothetical protein